MRLNKYNQPEKDNLSDRDENGKIKRHPHFEENHKLAIWFHKFWNDKARQICRIGENDAIFVWKDRIEIVWDDGSKLCAIPVSYNMFTNDFKRDCTNCLLKAKVLG